MPALAQLTKPAAAAASAPAVQSAADIKSVLKNYQAMRQRRDDTR